MSEIVLDRIRLGADGSLDLVVLIRLSGDASPPSAATVHLVAREGGDDLTVRGALADRGEGQWSASFEVAHEALQDLPAAVQVLDCTVDVVLDGEVLSRRVVWDGGGTRWLPYPTAGRKLSLARVAS